LGGEKSPRRTYDPGVAAAPEIHRWSPEDYHRLVDSGALDELRVELIDGFIVDLSPTSRTTTRSSGSITRSFRRWTSRATASG
jgi:Uma2 family endonuclease